MSTTEVCFNFVKCSQWQAFIQHQHFYLPTCPPLSTHPGYSQIIQHYLAFCYVYIPSASILGLHNKEAISPAPSPVGLIFLLSLSLCPDTLSCSLPSSCTLFFWTSFSLVDLLFLPSDGCQMTGSVLSEDQCTPKLPWSAEQGHGPIRQALQCLATQERTKSGLIVEQDMGLSPNNGLACKRFLSTPYNWAPNKQEEQLTWIFCSRKPGLQKKFQVIRLQGVSLQHMA